MIYEKDQSLLVENELKVINDDTPFFLGENLAAFIMNDFTIVREDDVSTPLPLSSIIITKKDDDLTTIEEQDVNIELKLNDPNLYGVPLLFTYRKVEDKIKEPSLLNMFNDIYKRISSNNDVINGSNDPKYDTFLTYQIDNIGRSFGTTYADGWVPEPFVCRKNSLVRVEFSLPMRNNDASWGGGYTVPLYSIDGGTTWTKIGDSGYDGPMVRNQNSITTYTNFFLLDFRGWESDIEVMIKFRHKAFSGTLLINNHHDINDDGDPLTDNINYPGFGFSKILAFEITASKGEKGEKGDIGPTGLPGPSYIAEAWDVANAPYSKFEIIAHSGGLWLSLQDDNTVEPGMDNNYWETFVNRMGPNIPIGTILPWHKNVTDPPLEIEDGFMECNGQIVTDPDSPLNGVELPNLNNDLYSGIGRGRYLRGGVVSGVMNESTYWDDNGYAYRSGGGGGYYGACHSAFKSLDDEIPDKVAYVASPLNGNDNFRFQVAAMTVTYIMKIKHVRPFEPGKVPKTLDIAKMRTLFKGLVSDWYDGNVITSGSLTTVAGFTGSAISMDQSDEQYAILLDPYKTQYSLGVWRSSVTICGWFKSTVESGGTQSVIFSRDRNDWYCLDVQQSSLNEFGKQDLIFTFDAKVKNLRVIAGHEGIEPNKWYFISFVAKHNKDGGAIHSEYGHIRYELKLDLVPIYNKNDPSREYTSVKPIVLGSNTEETVNPGNKCRGIWDDWRVYNRALSIEELQFLYENPGLKI